MITTTSVDLCKVIQRYTYPWAISVRKLYNQKFYSTKALVKILMVTTNAQDAVHLLMVKEKYLRMRIIPKMVDFISTMLKSSLRVDGHGVSTSELLLFLKIRNPFTHDGKNFNEKFSSISLKFRNIPGIYFQQ